MGQETPQAQGLLNGWYGDQEGHRTVRIAHCGGLQKTSLCFVLKPCDFFCQHDFFSFSHSLLAAMGYPGRSVLLDLPRLSGTDLLFKIGCVYNISRWRESQYGSPGSSTGGMAIAEMGSRD
jgi:hypothetical protein